MRARAVWYRIIRHRGGVMEPTGPARVERRLAAILAADVAGYSRLMGKDEEGTLAALKAIRRELVDPKIAEQSLKNIARPLRVYRVRLGEVPATNTPAAALALPDKPSIAVLPFQNMSGDPEQEYFADGMVEEIITALSRIRWLFVIARN